MKHLIIHVQKELNQHLFQYLVLLTAGLLFLTFTFAFKGYPFLQFVILCGFTSFYIIWGIYHHAKNQSIRLNIVIEYILIGFAILFLLKVIFIP